MGRPAALTGALSFQLSGYVLGLVDQGPLLAGLAWVPWVLVVLAGERSAYAKTGVVALLLALQALSGDPQSVLYTVLAGVVLVAWSRDRRRGLVVLAGGGLGAAALAAVQLLPAWFFLAASTRQSAGAPFLLQWSLHPLRLLEILLPLPFGGPVDPPGWWPHALVDGPSALPFAWAPYLGAAALTLSIVGFARTRRAGFGATLVALGLLLALGVHGPLAALLVHVPPFRFFRYPEKYLALVALGAAILAGAGVERLAVRAAPRLRVRLVGGAAALALVLAAALYLFPKAFQAPFAWMVGASAPRGIGAADVVAPAALALAIAGLASAATLLVIRGAERRVPSLLWLLPVLVAVDLWGPAHRLVRTAPVELYEVRPALVDQVATASPLRPFRFVRDTRGLRRGAPAGAGYEALVRGRAESLASLRSALAGVYGLEEARGYGLASLDRWSRVSLATWQRPRTFAGIFNVCVALGPAAGGRYANRPGYVPRATNRALGVTVYGIEGCVPRLHGVASVTAVSGLQEALAALKREDFEAGRMAVVEGGADATFDPLTVREEVVNAASARARVEAGPGGGFLVFATSYAPGWTAAVDGAPTPIRPVDGAVMGVAVPPGAHEVTFGYRAPGLSVGAGVSGAALLTALLAAFSIRRRRSA